ncbi:hypothetical protein FOA52_003685 [Chlamydomonas sp. UWO 241]|nr:hypothetical protein FOA52_003685 [Chlamydomonas sp. UWO 241]
MRWQWLEKSAGERDALKLQHQLQELAADSRDVHADVQAAEESHAQEAEAAQLIALEEAAHMHAQV